MIGIERIHKLKLYLKRAFKRIKILQLLNKLSKFSCCLIVVVVLLQILLMEIRF